MRLRAIVCPRNYGHETETTNEIAQDQDQSVASGDETIVSDDGANQHRKLRLHEIQNLRYRRNTKTGPQALSLVVVVVRG